MWTAVKEISNLVKTFLQEEAKLVAVWWLKTIVQLIKIKENCENF